MLSSPTDTIQRIERFLRIDPLGAPPTSLPRANHKDFDGKAKEIECSIQRDLQAFYEPWNKRLYAMIRADQVSARGGLWRGLWLGYGYGWGYGYG